MRKLLPLMLLMPLACAGAQNTPDATVTSFWKALSSDAGASADTETLRQLFHEHGVVYGGHYKDGAPQLARRGATEFIQRYERVREKGFYECEI